MAFFLGGTKPLAEPMLIYHQWCSVALPSHEVFNVSIRKMGLKIALVN